MGSPPAPKRMRSVGSDGIGADKKHPQQPIPMQQSALMRQKWANQVPMMTQPTLVNPNTVMQAPSYSAQAMFAKQPMMSSQPVVQYVPQTQPPNVISAQQVQQKSVQPTPAHVMRNYPTQNIPVQIAQRVFAQQGKNFYVQPAPPQPLPSNAYHMPQSQPPIPQQTPLPPTYNPQTMLMPQATKGRGGYQKGAMPNMPVSTSPQQRGPSLGFPSAQQVILLHLIFLTSLGFPR